MALLKKFETLVSTIVLPMPAVVSFDASMKNGAIAPSEPDIAQLSILLKIISADFVLSTPNSTD